MNSKLSINLSYDIRIDGYDYSVTVYRNDNQIDHFQTNSFHEIGERLKRWEDDLMTIE